jgi:hypothetical protein
VVVVVLSVRKHLRGAVFQRKCCRWPFGGMAGREGTTRTIASSMPLHEKNRRLRLLQTEVVYNPFFAMYSSRAQGRLLRHTYR